MSKKKEYKPTKADITWRKGYDLGVQNTLRENDVAIQIGRAIIQALDKRYERAKEDY